MKRLLRRSALLLAVVLGVVVLSAHGSPHGVSVPRCPANVNTSSPFILADCSGPARQQTQVFLCWNSTGLYSRFNCIDNNINSPYTECNQDLYNADVVEFFIGPALSVATDPLHNYLELELSPNSVLFAANVTNPHLTCSGISDDLLPCSLFRYTAVRNDAQNSWWGEIFIPWSVLSSFPGADPSKTPPATVFRNNFFRIDTPKNANEEYSCWSCDNSNPACFHMPAYFGYLYLAD